MKWNVVREQQAARGKNATAKATFPVLVDAEKALDKERFDAHEKPLVFDKSLLDDGQSKNLHSQSCLHEIELDSSVSNTNVLFSGHLNHKTRVTNLTNENYELKARINFPSSSDPLWKDIDGQLAIILPRVFTQGVINKLDSSSLSKKLDSWLYDFFKEKFGIVSISDKGPSTKRVFKHRGLERLRKMKNATRKEYKALMKAGLGDSWCALKVKARWKSLLKKHNRLRISVSKLKSKREICANNKSFRQDPHKFASRLFKDLKNGKPTFSQEEATNYFSSTYRDEEREHTYSPLPEFSQPTPPKVLFESDCPSLRDLKISVRKKSNKAAPGINALTYVPYKKCHSIMLMVHKIVKKIWSSKSVPNDWAQAFVVLLSKSDILDDPSEFRPIAITNTVGKIFFSVISDRLQKFLLRNNYIDRATQKGFLSGLPGCLEHSFTFYEALRNAKENQRQIVVAWIDLANAYGSVRHNLIQFALSWYNVPECIQSLIFDYYEKLMAKIQTSEWSTGFFLFDIGLFQGCVLSTILFDAVFQILLDMLKPLNNKHGYKMIDIDYVSLSRAYADDLALSAKSPAGCQQACDTCDSFLKWSKTMMAKPRKCVALGFRQFDPRYDRGKYKKHYNVKYSPFDPEIYISGKRMRFIFNDAQPDDAKQSLLRDHFKFLGRWISIDLNEIKVQEFVRARALKEFALIDKCKINGFIKLWLYQHYWLSHLAWPFLIHDFPISFARALESDINLRMKKWIGLYRGADNGSLFRSRKLLGLGLTSTSHFFCKMQVIKCSLLDNSTDSNVKSVFQKKSNKSLGWSKKWNPTKVYKDLSNEVFIRSKFPPQTSKLGLGHKLFIGDPSKKDIRKLTVATLSSIEDETRLAHSIQLERQGNWTTWLDNVIPFDFSWENLIYGYENNVISFVLNASINTCCTPVLLKLWRFKASAACAICGHEVCTLHHIISNCATSLKQHRYNWRHDSILKELQINVLDHLKSRNKKSPRHEIKFVPKGYVGPLLRNKGKPLKRSSMLDGADDWELLVDFDHDQIAFPPEIHSTAERPDMLLFSRTTKMIYLIELTCPAEEGFEAAVNRKEGRYANLLTEINTNPGNPWNASLTTIEVGARGFVAHSVPRFLYRLGMSSRKVKKICKNLSLICAKCSFTIFTMRAAPNWDRNCTLLRLNNATTSSSSAKAPTTPSPLSPLKDQKKPLKKVSLFSAFDEFSKEIASLAPKVHNNVVNIVPLEELEARLEKLFECPVNDFELIDIPKSDDQLLCDLKRQMDMG